METARGFDDEGDARVQRRERTCDDGVIGRTGRSRNDGRFGHG
jgi:hypothetical protein